MKNTYKRKNLYSLKGFILYRAVSRCGESGGRQVGSKRTCNGPNGEEGEK